MRLALISLGALALFGFGAWVEIGFWNECRTMVGSFFYCMRVLGK